jgi:N-acetyl-gamma-glutamyl-phosphate reductase
MNKQCRAGLLSRGHEDKKSKVGILAHQNKDKIKAAIIGVTGYVGQELFRILSLHPNVEISHITSVSYQGKELSEIYENFNKTTTLICTDADIEKIAEEADIMFLALPHGIASKKINQSILNKCKVIDLGADFRLKSKDVYESWYAEKHESEELLAQAVYGLCELNREKIKKASLIANPGCYTTCSILSLTPLLKEKLIDTDSIIIDAKSGVTGAGRSLNLATSYCETNESVKAYKIASHRHTPEIEQELSIAAGKEITLSFTPHLVPMNRGILTTSYAKLKKKVSYQKVKAVYEKYYKDEYFIRLTKENVFPETKWVKGSNFVDIGFKIDERTNNIIVIGAIDNLIKGAAGQAVQNMNIIFGFDEKTAIDNAAIFPV